MFSWFEGLLVPWDGAGGVGGQQVFDLSDQAIEIDGLGVKIISPRITGRLFVFSSGVGGESDNGNSSGLWVAFESTSGFPAVHHRET